MENKEDNNVTITKAFDIMRPMLAAFVAQSLEGVYKQSGWWSVVLDILSRSNYNLPATGEYAELVDSLDMAACLRIIDVKWADVFRQKFGSKKYRSYVNELLDVRNGIAHQNGNPMKDDDMERALDTMARVCEVFDQESAEQIREILRNLRYRNVPEQKAVPESPTTEVESKVAVVNKAEGEKDNIVTSNCLPSWRNVMVPHPDVVTGRYKTAEFAVDLQQIAEGEGAFEYSDPVMFFERTYITESMKKLLVQALKRVTGQDGDPVIQLKTAFGGGKTHTMLALYHMLQGKVSAEKLPVLKPILEEIGLDKLPKVNVAVLVGTALNPAKPKRPTDISGITVRTLWGEIVYQLAKASDNDKLYDLIKESDLKSISPGSSTLREIFDTCGPCLILIDELVAYARKIYEVKGLPAGTFENLMNFVQELTEAVKASKNSLVVASLPESEREIVGDGGREALRTIEHYFGRVESIWKPIGAQEGFEVVRRRLFSKCADENAKEDICRCFAAMYSEQNEQFPLETKEVDYHKRLLNCYPIHPELFDILYNDWAALPNFQRTRGVLRFMAALIHKLSEDSDPSPMIMPGSVAFGDKNIGDEMVKYLPDGESWSSIIHAEVDGKNSVPYKIDQKDWRYKQIKAAQKIACAIMLGSAPKVGSQGVRGLDKKRLYLGTVQPGQQMSAFNDVLNALREESSYLYCSGERYWYDVHPTLQKLARERGSKIDYANVQAEITSRLDKLCKVEEPLEGRHICPESSSDINDNQNVRLVVLGLSCTYNSYESASSENSTINSTLFEFMGNLLKTRGSGNRINQNMLFFLAPDKSNYPTLKSAVVNYLAWKSIQEDELNLDKNQQKEVKQRIATSSDNINSCLKETYRWLLVPSTEQSGKQTEITWKACNLGSGDLIDKVVRKLKDSELVVTKWAPNFFREDVLNLFAQNGDDNSVITVKQAWDQLCIYCYMQRLANYKVLEDCLKNGVASGCFAIASSKDEKGYFKGLKFAEEIDTISLDNLLVPAEKARQQRQAEEEAAEKVRSEQQSFNAIASSRVTNCSAACSTSDSANFAKQIETEKHEPLTTHLYASVSNIDPNCCNNVVKKILENIVYDLIDLKDCELNLTFSVAANAKQGIPAEIVRAIKENSKSLDLNDFELN